jgi:flavorubredoxin
LENHVVTMSARILNTEYIGNDWHLLRADMPVPGLGRLNVNSLLLTGEEPIVVDTSLAELGTAYIEKLEQIIKPSSIKWIFLSHVDADHIGNLRSLLEVTTESKILTSFLGFGKLMLQGFDASRIQVVEPGVEIFINGRQFKILKPPYYDAPETIGFLELNSKILFCSDCFGAVFNDEYSNIDEISDETLKAGLDNWIKVDTPWLKSSKKSWLVSEIHQIKSYDSKLLLSSHFPGKIEKIDRMLDSLLDVYVSISQDAGKELV